MARAEISMHAESEVSILLPVFDAATTLPTCLRSIVRQTHERWECVLVDDGSTDAGPALAEAAAATDARFRVVTTPHRGLVAALNAGLAQCRGRYVARMDADDWMRRDRLECQTAALSAAPELAAVGSRVRLFPRAGLRDGMRRYEAWLNGMESAQGVRADSFIECPVAHPSLLIRREVLVEFGYRDVGWPEDYDLFLRLQREGQAVGVVPRRLLAKRWHSQCLSRRSEVYAAERFLQCKASHLADSFLEQSDRYVLWGYGQTGRALRRALAERGKRAVAIVEVHPRRLGNTIHGAPVIAPDSLLAWREHPLVASVSGTDARNQIRVALSRMGYREWDEFVCAA
jgi:cellulose synthase/poly-beta-1,6-N-acetylglucosamine synthase-like glycosyltransferase